MTETEETETETEADSSTTGEGVEVQLEPLNDSGAEGTAAINKMDDGSVEVTLETHGVVPGAPHAQHFHIGGRNECPDVGADKDGDDIISTAEGQPAYGGVQLSLTTEGDFAAASALAVDRFPTADDQGNVSYSRTFDSLPSNVMDAIEQGTVVVVQHGIDVNGDGAYDGGAGTSSLDPKLPLEATAPALCGAMEPMTDAATSGNTNSEGTGTETGDAATTEG